MKRAVGVTALTVVGVAWILTYKVAPHQLSPVALMPPTPEGEASPSTSPSATPRPSPTPTPAAPSGTFTGVDVPNRFGDVVVRIVLSRGHMTDVQAVTLPTDRAESAYISQQAGPMLRTEALQAQSANIDIISGATYTSESYAQSLESALKKAHLG
jgi:uncharacterized protein with FMN-binding domain